MPARASPCLRLQEVNLLKHVLQQDAQIDASISFTWVRMKLQTLLTLGVQAIIEALVWSSITYWLVGLAPEAGRCGASTGPCPGSQSNGQLVAAVKHCTWPG